MVVLVSGTRRSPGRGVSPTGISRVWRRLVVMGSYQGCWVPQRAVGWTRAQPGLDWGCNRPGNRGKNRPRVRLGWEYGWEAGQRLADRRQAVASVAVGV